MSGNGMSEELYKLGQRIQVLDGRCLSFVLNFACNGNRGKGNPRITTRMARYYNLPWVCLHTMIPG